MTSPSNAKVAQPGHTIGADPFAQARQYLARVVPWPTAGDAYINVHNTFVSANAAKPLWGGRACTSVNDAINAIQYALSKPDTRNIYVCMSSQAMCEDKVSEKGRKYKKPIRNQQNAVALKSLFLDIDCKGGGYGSLEEAAAALASFIKAVGLPKPSIMVASGGGVHVYWVLAHALAPDQWKPLAFALAESTKRHGLKCDTQCTVDAARVLRIPNTFNRKTDPPRPVRIVGTPTDVDYAVERIVKALEPYMVAVPAAQSPASFLANPALFAAGPSAVFKDASTVNELGAGIGSERPPIDLDQVAKECAFVRDAIATGGATYSQPMWNITTLISTFTVGGCADAHRMGNKHSGYTKESTNALYDRKAREKVEKQIGWPSCRSVSASGCKACQACPHFAAGKSPLHWGRQTLPSQVTSNEPSFADPWAVFAGPSFPLAILPPPLKDFVDAEHQAIGADLSAIAIASLTALAGAIHAETRVRMGDAWTERPILWTALVGAPSSMKSPVIDKSTAPLRKIDHDEDARWRRAYTLWSQSKSAGTNPGPCPPKPARQLIQDATPEKVAELLARAPAGSLMVHDELAGHIGSFDRYGSGHASRSLFLSSFNGGTFLRDRIGQGKRDEDAETRVENLALCILGGIQPDRLAQMKDLTTDGLLQRYLLVAVKAPIRGDEHHSVQAAEREYSRLIKSVQQAVSQEFTFSQQAAGVRRDVIDRLFALEQLQGFSDALIGAIGKMRGYYGRVTLTLHVANEHASLITGLKSKIDTVIPVETAQATERLLFEFILPHIVGVYDVIANGGKERETIRAIAGFILASDKDRFRPSDFGKGVRKLREESQEKIAEWASRFCAMGWLLLEDEKAVISKAWVVAPGLRAFFAERRQQVQQARAEMHAILAAGGTRK